MTTRGLRTCVAPPEGWVCSRASGHEGPCAARPDKPYAEYVDRTVRNQKICDEGWSEDFYEFSGSQLRALLADAWLSGLAYSLNLVEGEKERRDGIL
jgi:hypothetical protein